MDDLFAVLTTRLDAAGIASRVTGSVAAMVYGEPRLTNGIDLVVVLDVAAVARPVAAFPPQEFYCAPAEVIRVEMLRGHRGRFNIIHHGTGFKADVYIAGRDPLHRWALKRTRTLAMGATSLRVAPPEYVIVRKLEYFREGHSPKHVHDIERMLAQLGDQLDGAALDEMIAQRGLASIWAQVLAGDGG